ncbi:MAG: DMT family transporter [Nitriliruptorales bacterium]
MLSMPFAGGLAVLAGVLVAVQAGLLGPFARHVQPFVAGFWVHAAGAVFAAAAVAATGLSWGWSGIVAFPWGLAAGLAGVGIVASIGAAVVPLGLGTTIVVVTATQLAVALVLDAVGMSGRVVPITVSRLLGVVLVVAGALLVFNDSAAS